MFDKTVSQLRQVTQLRRRQCARKVTGGGEFEAAAAAVKVSLSGRGSSVASNIGV